MRSERQPPMRMEKSAMEGNGMEAPKHRSQRKQETRAEDLLPSLRKPERRLRRFYFCFPSHSGNPPDLKMRHKCPAVHPNHIASAIAGTMMI